MDQLKLMCHERNQFPMNLPSGEYVEYFVSLYYEQLNRHQHRLFSPEQDSELTFREYAAHGRGWSWGSCVDPRLANVFTPTAFWNANVRSLQDLISHFDINYNAQKLDPRCRFL